MWLTGFDAPSLHTMYVDKPMRGHGLMQAIARVNRVFKDKPGGLVVDYLGLAEELRQALVTYTEAGGTGKAGSIKPKRSPLCLASTKSAQRCSTALTARAGSPARRRKSLRCCRRRKSTSSTRMTAKTDFCIT